MANTQIKVFMSGFKELYQTGLFSDLVINCGDAQFRAHGVIIYPQSKVLRTMIAGKFKEGQLAILDINDDDPQVFQTMLNYFYTFVYDDSVRGERAVQTFTVQVYAIADKYDVPQLQTMAAQKFKSVCNPISDVNDFLNALAIVDSSTNPGDSTLWDIIVPATQANITFLLQHEQFKDALDDMPEFKWELLGRLDPARARSVTSMAHFLSSKKDTTGENVNDEVAPPGFGGPTFIGGRRLGDH